MQKSTSLTGTHLAEGKTEDITNVKQASKNKKPKKGKKSKIIAVAPEPLSQNNPKG